MEWKAVAADESGLSAEAVKALLTEVFAGRELKKVLILPPDITRYYSNAGFITNVVYHMLRKRNVEVDIMPALGTHQPMTADEITKMYGDIPQERFLVHNWRTDVVKLGEVPGEFIAGISEGLWTEPIAVEVNRRLMDPSYDCIFSVGQVVPHEVIGMANHSKNLFVGAGGSDMINKTHMVGALYGLERVMGRDHMPVREIFDYALKRFLSDRPILFALTVTTAPEDEILTHGLFIGDTRKTLEDAIALAQEKTITYLDTGVKKCVVYLSPEEFRSTWVGNKAVYRTRMAIADGGELLVLAPGVECFGEDPAMDALIRKYGYCGTERILNCFRDNEDLRANMSAAAHLIHGSSEGRFSITYAVKRIAKEDVERVCFRAADYDEMAARYDPAKLTYGYHTMDDGEEIFFIPNPALGLWINKERF